MASLPIYVVPLDWSTGRGDTLFAHYITEWSAPEGASEAEVLGLAGVADDPEANAGVWDVYGTKAWVVWSQEAE